MEVNVHHAKTHLSKLIAAVESGEEVIIARAGKPAVQLVVVQSARRPRREIMGIAKGLMRVPTAEQWRAMDKELEAEMLDRPIFPPVSV